MANIPPTKLNSIGYLEICVGPMFAGKTTYLLHLIEKLNKNSIDFLIIKPVIDNRYSTSNITSHDNVSYPCINAQYLKDIASTNVKQHVLIEEGQFFFDLFDTVQLWLSEGKKVYVAGLNGDSEMRPFGDIHKLMSIADNIIYKHAICVCGDKASFTSRIYSPDSTNCKSQILIGGADKYISTCRKCYHANKLGGCTI